MEYTPQIHWYLTILGLLLLGILVFTLRMETSFLIQYRKHKLQFVLSIISIFIMLFLTLTTLFHWTLSPFFTFSTVMILVPILLILAMLILWLRARAFRDLKKDRIEEQKKLIREVQYLIDEKKRETIREKKADRGEMEPQ